MIGVLLFAAIILLMGTTRVIVPLIKAQPTFTANQGALTINTVLAAPETITTKETFKKDDKSVLFLVLNGAVVISRDCKNEGTNYHENNYVQDKMVKTDAQCPNKDKLMQGACALSDEHKKCYWWFGSGSDFKVTFSKLYSKQGFDDKSKDYALVIK